MSDDDSFSISRKELLQLALGGGSAFASAATDTTREVRLPLDVAERVYVEHDGEWYEIVADEDGVRVVDADE